RNHQATTKVTNSDPPVGSASPPNSLFPRLPTQVPLFGTEAETTRPHQGYNSDPPVGSASPPNSLFPRLPTQDPRFGTEAETTRPHQGYQLSIPRWVRR